MARRRQPTGTAGLCLVMGAVAGVHLAAAACGSDESSSRPPGTTTSSQTDEECLAVCEDLYECTRDVELCPNLEDSTLEHFLDGDTAEGCLHHCNEQPAMKAIVDPDDCATTVQTLCQLNADFAVCCLGEGGNGPSCS